MILSMSSAPTGRSPSNEMSGSPKACRALVDKADAAFGKLDCIVASAGIGMYGGC